VEEQKWTLDPAFQRYSPSPIAFRQEYIGYTF
jgi:hypothetical protein